MTFKVIRAKDLNPLEHKLMPYEALEIRSLKQEGDNLHLQLAIGMDIVMAPEQEVVIEVKEVPGEIQREALQRQLMGSPLANLSRNPAHEDALEPFI